MCVCVCVCVLVDIAESQFDLLHIEECPHMRICQKWCDRFVQLWENDSVYIVIHIKL